MWGVRLCRLALILTLLSSCAYIKSHDYNAAPKIIGIVKNLDKPVSSAEVVLEYTENERTGEIGVITSSTDDHGRFEIGPIEKHRKGFFVPMGAFDLIVPYKFAIVLGGITYRGIEWGGYWNNPDKIFVVCELSRPAYPLAKNSIDLASRCKFDESN